MSVTVDAMRGDAEAAIGRTAIGLAVRSGHGIESGTAIPARPEAHRHRADSGTSHQCQDDASRAFHDAVRSWLARAVILAPLCGKLKPALHGEVGQPPKEKCEENAWAEEPKPPRLTLLEWVFVVEDEWEELLL